MDYVFNHGSELCNLCRKYDLPISEIMLRSEIEESDRSRDSVLQELQGHIITMRDAILNGLDENYREHGIFVGGDAARMLAFAGKSNLGPVMARAAAVAMATVEYNASMGIIVAAPTAGASGILPAVLFVCGAERGFSDSRLIEGLLTAGAVGRIIAQNASIAGAAGGCQAETGTAAAMAAAALAQLCGANPEECLEAAAIALKNCMGLVCDPVGGLVECPCVKRNAIGAVNAVLSCDMVLAGIHSLIPFDEVVDAMKRVGQQMHPDLKETARGGVAATPTGKRLGEKLRQKKGTI